MCTKNAHLMVNDMDTIVNKSRRQQCGQGKDFALINPIDLGDEDLGVRLKGSCISEGKGEREMGIEYIYIYTAPRWNRNPLCPAQLLRGPRQCRAQTSREQSKAKCPGWWGSQMCRRKRL